MLPSGNIDSGLVSAAAGVRQPRRGDADQAGQARTPRCTADRNVHCGSAACLDS